MEQLSKGFVKRSLPMETIKEVYEHNAKLVKWEALDIQTIT